MKKFLLNMMVISIFITPSAFAHESCIDTINEHYNADLDQLSLDSCGIDDKDIKLINNFCEQHDVKKLYLHGNKISEVGAEELSWNKTVESLDVSENLIKDIGAIETLQLSDNNIGNAGAIEREKQIKGWSRKKKQDLINSLNPEWDDLYRSLC